MTTLTTEEILDLLDASDTGPDTLVAHVETLIDDHRDEAVVMAALNDPMTRAMGDVA